MSTQVFSHHTRTDSLLALLLPHLPHLQSLFRGLDTAQHHRSKSRAHSVAPVQLTQLHAPEDQARDHLARALDDRVLRGVHVQGPHATQGDGAHAGEALGAEGAKGPVVAGGADDEGRVDGVGVHAAVLVVVLGHERPVGDDADDARDRGVRDRARDEVLDAGGVEELDVRHGEDGGQERAHEVRGVLDHDVVAFVFVGDAEVVC